MTDTHDGRLLLDDEEAMTAADELQLERLVKFVLGRQVNGGEWEGMATMLGFDPEFAEYVLWCRCIHPCRTCFFWKGNDEPDFDGECEECASNR